MDTSDHCGLFGKLPQQSDFVSLHLPQQFTDYWHQWLQSCISISKEQLGEAWLEQYLVSPIWRFALMPGIAAQDAIVGVTIPSVDEVGRYFPLTLAHSGAYCPWSAYLYGESWFEQAEQILLSALADNTTYSEVVGALESSPLPKWDAIPTHMTQAALDAYKGNAIRSKPEGTTPSDFALTLLPTIYQHRYGDHSLWWTQGSETINPCLAVSNQLPDPGQFSAMLDGQWQTWGWAEEAIQENNKDVN